MTVNHQNNQAMCNWARCGIFVRTHQHSFRYMVCSHWSSRCVLFHFQQEENQNQFTFMQENQEYYIIALPEGWLNLSPFIIIQSKEIWIIEKFHMSHLFTILRTLFIMDLISKKLLEGLVRHVGYKDSGMCHINDFLGVPSPLSCQDITPKENTSQHLAPPTMRNNAS